MPNNRIEDLHPELALVYTEAKAAMKAAYPLGPWPELNETLRSLELQTAYYAQGRKPLDEVNRLRRLAGEYEIGAAENKNIITWAKAGQSPHFYRMALDVRIRLLTPKTKPNQEVVATDKNGIEYVRGGLDWGGTNANKWFVVFGGFMIAAARKLKAEGKIKISVRWGHDWNGDGIANDGKLDDPHHEVKGWAAIVAAQHLAAGK